MSNTTITNASNNGNSNITYINPLVPDFFILQKTEQIGRTGDPYNILTNHFDQNVNFWMPGMNR